MVRSRESRPPLYRPGPSARTAQPAGQVGDEPSLGVASAHAGPLLSGRPAGVGGGGSGSAAPAVGGPGRAVAAVGGRRGLLGAHPRGGRRSSPLPHRASLVPAASGRGRGTSRVDRLLLHGVRPHRGAAELLGRARRARGRPPQVGLRPGGPPDRGRLALPLRLLPPGSVVGGLAGRALPGDRSARVAAGGAHRRGRPPGGGQGRHARSPHVARQGVEGTGGTGSAAAAGQRSAGQRRRAPRHHRPALRRRRRAQDPSADPRRCRRGAGRARLLPAHRASAARGLPHQRGPRRFPGAGAHQGAADRPGVGLRPGHGRCSGRDGVHHAHPGPGRYRPVPGGPGAALLRRRVPAAAASGGACRSRAGAGRRGQPGHVQHGAHGAAAGAARERGLGAARRSDPQDVPQPLAGVRGRGGPDPLGHQRGARADLVRP